jgi:TonB-dependent receptor
MLKKITIVFKKSILLSMLPLLFVASSINLLAQNGSIKGVIKDSQTGASLPFCNAILVGTSFGCASDKEGSYIIRNIPPGKYTLRATYLGYQPKEVRIEITEGKTIERNIVLTSEALKGETVTVTAQAEGQMKAINEQLSSMSIKNVVSAAKIQELPDANAAESISRLPGVSLIREGGEGSKVVIRGLSPQYNQITIDGVEMASDVASNNNIRSTDANQQDVTGNIMGDRGTDLSMISSSMLGGIEVIKAITPDMDAAVLGGVVNFDMRKAARNISTNTFGINEPWLPLFDITSQGGYNRLKEAYGDYKLVGSIERRFLNESFGVFIQGTTEKRNLSDNEFGATYQLNDKTHGDAPVPDLNTLALTDAFRVRERSGATVVLDYSHETGDIAFMNFYSYSDTKTTNRIQTEQLNSINEQILYDLQGTESQLNILNNLLSIKQSIPLFQVNLKLSHSYSESHNPGDATFDFVQQRAGLTQDIINSISKVQPSIIATYFKPSDTSAVLYNIKNSESESKEHIYNGALDLEHDFSISDFISAKIKFGGTYQYRTRSYEYSERNGSTVYDGGGAVTSAFSKSYPGLVYGSSTNISGLSLSNFVYNGYNYGNFLNGEYKIAYPLNSGLLWLLNPIAVNNNSGAVSGGGYKANKLASTINNYSGNEKRSAGYTMLTFNIGDQITILPGARYQNLTTTYTAVRGENTPSGMQGGPVTITQSHGYLLPMLHLMYKPLGWLQAHFAYTNTLNYPDYSVITPRYYIGSNFISYNNVRLKPATSENFDLVLSAYSNEIGLLTIDGFKKTIKDLIFYSHTYVTDLSPYPDLPQGKHQLYDFTTYINSPDAVDLYGIETDWQTHLWYLPQPFSGLIFSINYTHIFSQAVYPKTIVNTVYSEDGTAVTNYIDTTYRTRLLNQPNDIANLALGYDYEGFSFRISMLYQDNIFKLPDFWMQNRVNSSKYTRWDISVKQALPWYNVQLFLDLNNITGTNDVDVNQRTSFLASEQRYGMTGDVGIRIKL